MSTRRRSLRLKAKHSQNTSNYDDRNYNKRTIQSEDEEKRNVSETDIRKRKRKYKEITNDETENTNPNPKRFRPNDVDSRLEVAWQMCKPNEETSDLKHWVGLVYFGIKTYNKRVEDKHPDVIRTVANTFHLEEEQVLNHLLDITK
eukprot:88048_1